MNQSEIITAPIADAMILRGIVDRPSACGAFNFRKMKEIQVGSKGKYAGKYSAQVDDEDYDIQNQWMWGVRVTKKTCYAYRMEKRDGKNKHILLHREIMQTPEDKFVDHRDHNGLHCEKSNMRNCTRTENNRNKTTFGRSKYLGVNYSRKSIQSRITINGKRTFLGAFKTEEAAAHAYDEAAKKCYGEFANLNFK